MRTLLVAVCVGLLAGTLPLRGEEAQSQALKKLAEFRQMKKLQGCRKRLAILPLANESGVANAQQGISEEVSRLFGTKGFEILPSQEVKAALSASGEKTSWSNEELAQLAERLGAETLVFGCLKEYRAKRRFGLPLPSCFVSTDATVALEVGVFRWSANRIVWKDTVRRTEKRVIGGVYITREHARTRTGENAVEELIGRYFARKP